MKKFNILTLLVITILTTGSFVLAQADPVAEWIARSPIDAKLQAELGTSWTDAASASPSERLERFAQVTSRADARIGHFADLATDAWHSVNVSGLDKDLDNYPPVVADNLRLWFAKKLVFASMYDEAGELLASKKIKDDTILDPATLHFYRAVVAYRAMDKAQTPVEIDRLLAYETTSGVKLPERYKAVARLMKDDLAGVKPDSLDHVARQMEDIERRLDMSRSDKKVQDKEQKVIDTLNKIIEELEKQQQGGGGSSLQSPSPAEQSKLMGGKGEGKVDQTQIGRKDGWGNLPDKDRVKAMHDLERRFPAHYREVIEQYFRRRAQEEPEGQEP